MLRLTIQEQRILISRSPFCEFPVGGSLISKSLLEGWSGGFFCHSVKLGRFFQILTDEFHDVIPFSRAVFQICPLNNQTGLRFLRVPGSCPRARTREMRAASRTVRLSAPATSQYGPASGPGHEASER